LAGLLFLPSQAANAEDPVQAHAVHTPAQPQVPDVTLPALTPVILEILTALGSGTSKSGDLFALRLAHPIVINNRVVVAAGRTGTGEVVHAKSSGGMGAAGELVLAARFLDIDGRQLRLRSLRLVGIGKSNIATVNALNVASAASFTPVSLIGYFITGGQIEVPAGALVEARTAQAFAVSPPRNAEPVPQQQPTSAAP